MPRSIQKNRSSKPKRRQYDNSSRAEKSEQTRKKIIETLVQILVEQKGGEVSMDELAKRSGITQRTIFRFFKDKRTLHESMDEYLVYYLKSGAEQMESLDFIGFAKNAFKLFDKHEALTTAYVFSPFGQEARVLFRKKFVQLMISKIAQETKITITPERRKRLALITSMVNAKIWMDLKSDFGFSGEDMGSSLDWALNLLLRHLDD